jgi:hypothetical protein
MNIIPNKNRIANARVEITKKSCGDGNEIRVLRGRMWNTVSPESESSFGSEP